MCDKMIYRPTISLVFRPVAYKLLMIPRSANTEMQKANVDIQLNPEGILQENETLQNLFT